jgi:hypothetical protein
MSLITVQYMLQNICTILSPVYKKKPRNLVPATLSHEKIPASPIFAIGKHVKIMIVIFPLQGLELHQLPLVAEIE